MTLVSSSVVITAPGLISVPTLDAPQSHAARERRANHRVFETRLRGGEPGAIGLERGFELVELRLRQSLGRHQLAAAIVETLALGDGGLGRCDVGPGLRIVELHQQLATLHACPSPKLIAG
jgi:hypothetical protein